MIESKELLSTPLNALSEMYPVFESPFPTLITHTDNGLGIFVAHPKVSMAVKSIGADDAIFRVSTEELNFFFPLKVHAQVLLKSRGGVLAFTDENGMPWYTLEMAANVEPVVREDTKPAAAMLPRAKFGRPTAKRNAMPIASVQLGDEGEFSI